MDRIIGIPIATPMATEKNFVDQLVEHLSGAGEIRSRAMFGEYVLYCGTKLFALVCDNTLFIKPTAAGKSFLGRVVGSPPYPGAKLCFLIKDPLREQERICELVRITAKELPEPKPKKKRKKG